jgi:YrbI family 3-deoxy-D-manno-octulosonate 8-phosphate phosphatase
MAQDSFDRIAALRRIQIVIFDFDGVFTDNRVSVREDGLESVTCWRSDGIGLSSLTKCGVKAAIVSAESNPVVSERAKKLQVECFSGSENKSQVVANLLQREGIDSKNAAFVGNDTPDLEAMKMVGIGIAVADAYPAVIQKALIVTSKPGGFGAVREVCDWIVEAHQT